MAGFKFLHVLEYKGDPVIWNSPRCRIEKTGPDYLGTGYEVLGPDGEVVFTSKSPFHPDDLGTGTGLEVELRKLKAPVPLIAAKASIWYLQNKCHGYQ